MKNFMEAVMDHPRYNASLWSDFERNPDLDRPPVLAFLDADVCHTVHWPFFGGDANISYDKENGKRKGGAGIVGYSSICAVIDQALASPVLVASPQSRLFVLNCGDEEGGKLGQGRECLGPHRDAAKYKQLVVGHTSKPYHLVNPQDFGIPPWPVKTVDIERESVCNISSLPYLMGHKGRARNHFYDFAFAMNDFKKNRSDIYVEFGFQHYIDSTHPNGIHNQKVIAPTPKELQTNETYYHVMTHSKFCTTGRGDNIFSVRFSEVLSAGCIPIVYADGWVMPFTRSVVDWTKIAVIIPQRHVRQTLQYIEDMPDEEICERRLRAYDVFHKYVKDGKGRVDAILKIMDRRLRTGRIEPYQYTPGVSTHKDSLEYPEDHPLRQNRLGKTVSDPNYPITPGLRKDYHRAEPIDRKLNPLIVNRACTRLTFVNDASIPEQIQNCIQDVDTLIKEDKPSNTTVGRRWVATLNGIDPTCLLRQAIQDALEARKANKGNPKSYGLRDDEKMEYNDDFLHMEALPLQTPFWVRAKNHQDPVPTTADDKGYTIFSTFTHEGLIGRVREKRSNKTSGNEALRFNTTHYIADRPQQHLTLACVLDSRGRRQYIGEDGQESFILVWLIACSPDIRETKKLQLGMIENLKLGTHFAIRKNARSSSEIPIPVLPEEYVGAPTFNMPVWTGVRDRLGKFDRAAKEIKEIDLGDWMLCEVVVKERRGPRSGAAEEEEDSDDDDDDTH